MNTTSGISDSQQPLRIGLHAGVWALAFFAYAYAFSRFFPLQLSLLRSLVNMLPMAGLFYANLFLGNRWMEKRMYWQYVAFSTIMVLVMTGLRVKINLLFPEIEKAAAHGGELFNFRVGAFVTNLGVYFISTLYLVIQNREKEERRRLALIHSQNEAQLQSLRAQINPHFLFNTLNNIYALAVTRSPKTADMVLKLSNLLRYITYEGAAAKTTLGREVEHIRELIDLFQMRSEEPLDITFEVNGDIAQLEVEPMILIPLVENCFKHCDFDTNEKAFTRLTLKQTPNGFSFRTLNSKNDQDRQKDELGGVGLENIQRRLALKYPDGHHLRIQPADFTFEVELTIP